MPNLANPLFVQGQKRGGKVAVYFGNQSHTFRDLLDSVRAVAGGLRASGFRPGDKLGIMLTSRPEFIVFEQAAFTLGGVVSPLNVHYQPSEIAHAVVSCDLDYLVIERDLFPRLPENVGDRFRSLRRVFVLGGGGVGHGGDLVRPAEHLWAEGQPIEAPVARAPEDLGLMLSTSATTGKAKGVMLTIANIQANYDPTPEWLGLSESDVILCALPLYNTFGLNQCINATMVTGCAMVLLPRFDPLACLTAIAEHRCTFFPAVPTMLQKVLGQPEAAASDLTSVQRILVGAAPVPAPLLQRIYAMMGSNTDVMTGYGLTEATAIVSIVHVELDREGRVVRPKSVGQALPGIEMMIAGEQGSPAAANVVGEICIKGPNVMKGYYKLPEETASAIVGGWLHTGDLGYMDEDRHFYIVDRKKDVIIRGGQNIFPIDIEEVIYRHPAVGEVAVVGEADEVLGEVPVAYVSLKMDKTASAEELLELCKAELAYYKVPRFIRFLTELPKGPTGKILRRGLRRGTMES